MSRHRIGTLLTLVAIGLVLGANCVIMGFFVVGMGHGWALPARYGFLSLLLYPLALARWGWVRRDAHLGVDMALTLLLLPSVAMVFSQAGPPPQSAILEGALVTLSLGWPVLYWLAARSLRNARLHAALGDCVLLAIGMALNHQAWRDFYAVHMFNNHDGWQLWAPFWLGWQAVAAAALYRHLRPDAAARPA